MYTHRLITVVRSALCPGYVFPIRQASAHVNVARLHLPHAIETLLNAHKIYTAGCTLLMCAILLHMNLLYNRPLSS